MTYKINPIKHSHLIWWVVAGVGLAIVVWSIYSIKTYQIHCVGL